MLGASPLVYTDNLFTVGMMPTSENTLLTTQLEKLIVGDPDFEQLEDTLFYFCPFEALGAVKAELRHSNFLANLMDPLRPHGFGDRVLQSFLKTVIAETGDDVKLTPLDVHLMDLSSVEIRREWNNIDILVLLPNAKVIFCFELKVGAKQHSNQLARYRSTVEKHWPDYSHVFVFLRPSNEEAEDDSWVNVGYDAIVDGLEHVLHTSSGDDLARRMLSSYIQMIKRNYLMDEKLQNLATSLWNKHTEALKFLADNRPDNLSQVFSWIIENAEEFCKNVSGEGLTFEPDVHAGLSYLRFGIREWDDISDAKSGSGWTATGRVLLVELQRARRTDSEKIRAHLILGPSSSPMREKLFEAVRPIMKDQKSKLSPKWKRLTSRDVLSHSDGAESFDAKAAIKKTIAEVKKFSDELIRFGERFKKA